MILTVGDIHGEFGHLNSLIQKKHPSIILQVGDFGYWPKDKKNQKIKNRDTIIYFCDGNHEDHESLRNLENNEIQENVFYMERGSTLNLPDGRTVLFMGGAFSHDWRYKEFGDVEWRYREVGIDWFPFMELVTEEDLNKIPDVKIDIVISHTAPKEFFMPPRDGGLEVEDPSRESLSQLLKKYQPKLWFFGHYHYFRYGFDYGCKWTGLSYVKSGDRWWVGIDLIR